MMLRSSVLLLVFIGACEVAQAFVPGKTSAPIITSMRTKWTRRNEIARRGADDDALVADELEALVAEKSAVAEDAVAKEETENKQKWVDPNAASGVQWYQLSWWGYLIIIYPTVLFLDDAFHFLPEGGVVGAFQQMVGIDNSLDKPFEI